MLKRAMLSACLTIPVACDRDGSDAAPEAGSTSAAAQGAEGHKARKTDEASNAGAGRAEDSPPAGDKGGTDVALFDKEIRNEPCEFLSSEAVARVAGVSAESIQQRELMGVCTYTWPGGSASLGHLRVQRDADAARRFFENSYADKTGGEVQEDLAKVEAEIERRKAEGKTDVDPADAKKLVTRPAGLAHSAGFTYEDVAGVGDAARFENTRNEMEIAGRKVVSYPNKLHVLVRNLQFSVSFDRKGEPTIYRDENIALAKAVLEKLGT